MTPLHNRQGHPSAPAVIDYLTALGFEVGRVGLTSAIDPPIVILDGGDRLLMIRKKADTATFRAAVRELESAGLRVSEAVSFSHDQRVYLR